MCFYLLCNGNSVNRPHYEEYYKTEFGYPLDFGNASHTRLYLSDDIIILVPFWLGVNEMNVKTSNFCKEFANFGIEMIVRDGIFLCRFKCIIVSHTKKENRQDMNGPSEYQRIDNSGRSVIRAFDNTSESALAMITWDIPNKRRYFSLSFDISFILNQFNVRILGFKTLNKKSETRLPSLYHVEYVWQI